MDATARRRWFGAMFLLAALALLLCGETLLKGRMSNLFFLIYWLVCLVLTGLAIAVAFADVRALQRRIREEQRQLFEATLRKIEKEKREKRG